MGWLAHSRRNEISEEFFFAEWDDGCTSLLTYILDVILQ